MTRAAGLILGIFGLLLFIGGLFLSPSFIAGIVFALLGVLFMVFGEGIWANADRLSGKKGTREE